jgi:hypothetical protein
VASQKRLAAAAAEVLDAPVSEVVGLVRVKDGGGWYMAGAATIFVVVLLFLDFEVFTVAQLLVYVASLIPISLLMQLAMEQRFAALTPAGIQLTSSRRWSPRPVGPPLGPLDLAVVSGPHGLFRNVFDVANVRVRVAVWQRARFQRMLAAAAGLP